ncbi:hypothetical protein DM860_011893 [Cuscuta australis]|uniref:Uncharacterized protein n=1 Tax=Cuscuta australis TaxID=267555 RepID=A0A328DAB2_9ASTE|nr:hypothetical protein DM860_011893 [Cuscuta australis]
MENKIRNMKGTEQSRNEGIRGGKGKCFCEVYMCIYESLRDGETRRKSESPWLSADSSSSTLDLYNCRVWISFVFSDLENLEIHLCGKKFTLGLVCSVEKERDPSIWCGKEFRRLGFVGAAIDQLLRQPSISYCEGFGFRGVA